MNIGGICELVLETEDVEALSAFYRELGLESILEEEDRVWLAVGERCRLGIWPPGEQEFNDRGGNRVELWDFFRDGGGARGGVMALAEDGDGA